jgi:hypothetical protein
MKMLLVLIVALQAGQGAPPDTEVFLAPLSTRGGVIEIGKPVNVSNNPGYDNQPSFTPDGRALLFTSVRGGRKPDPSNSAATGSDIYRYGIAKQVLGQLTDTPEAEYSPTVTPDGRHVSVIRVEADGTQRLWRFTIEGRSPELVLADIKPVGYHAWVDGNTLALFVLGQPATLQVADTRTGKAELVAKGIGRSIQRMPGGGVSFVLREPAGEGTPPVLTISELTTATRETKPLVRVPSGPADADTVWTPDGTLLVSHQGRILSWKRGEPDLKPIADLEALGLTSVTRLAISPDGAHIAIVAQHKR